MVEDNARRSRANRGSLQILLSVTPQKSSDISIVGFFEGFVGPVENYLTVAQHKDLSVYEAESFAFGFKHHFARIIDHRIFGTQIVQVVHFMGNKDR